MTDTVPTEAAISARQMEAWGALAHAHGRILRGVEQALAEADLPPVAWLNVLDSLDRSDDGLLRPRDLGCGVQISRSGLTRLLDRMEAAGAVSRNRCDEDRRGSYIGLTESGGELLARMREVSEAELAVTFGGLIDDDQAAELTALLCRVAGDD